MDIVKIVKTNEKTITNHAVCGYKSPKTVSYQGKMKWIRDQFKLGLRYNILHSENKGDIGGIEYIPGEYAWRPVSAEGYLFIHCIYIMSKPYKGQGYGKLLVQSRIDDAKENNFDGVAVLTRKGTWMAGSELFRAMNFEVVDTANPDYELWALKIKSSALDPSIRPAHETQSEKGLTIYYSNQCPYLIKSIPEIIETSEKEFKITLNVVELKSYKEAQQNPCTYGCCGIVYDGKILADSPLSKTRFKNLMNIRHTKP